MRCGKSSRSCSASSRLHAGGALHRANHAQVAAAAAEISVEGLLDLIVAGMWIFIEEHFRGHDHAVHAVTALRGLLFDEGRLERVRMLERAQAFEGRYAAILRAADGNAAGAHGASVHDDGAR